MKFILFSLIVFIGFSIHAQEVNQETAYNAAKAYVEVNNPSYNVIIESSSEDKKASNIWFFELSPMGYIAIAPDMRLKPVIAYSFDNNTDPDGILLSILNYDMSLRLQQMDLLPNDKKIANIEAWNTILSEQNTSPKNQLWPPAGSTPTGGWLLENWTQNAPYNNMVPIDPTNSTRSVAGCPAIAMSMIVNYQESINNTVFTDADDYYHNYGGRQYWIDDDYAVNGFPSFPLLNAYLDTLVMHYQAQQSLTNNDKAALVFACGVACKQVYTSSVSGTFGVSQALAAYYRFNFNTIEILYSGDTTIQTRLIQNMMDSLPAHLALVDSAGTIGHNIVVDGYDSNGLFHLNFGWGGTANGWYDIPAGIPYQLTVIEGVIVDIEKSPVTIVRDQERAFDIYPNPAKDYLVIEIPEELRSNTQVYVFNTSGICVYKNTEIDHSKLLINTSEFITGLYIIKLENKSNCLYKKFIIE
ncbi:MAG: C10 family peptidase [Bacteroidales bacterium]|nr:C10 family peptidase [Bacteroidales bacterium]